MKMLSKVRIALAVAIMALAALSTVDDASALAGNILFGDYDGGDYRYDP